MEVRSPSTRVFHARETSQYSNCLALPSLASQVDLCDLIIEVPDLLKWLISEVSGLALKHWCLVSKPLRRLAMGHVKRCALTLDGLSDQPPRLATLLKHSQLMSVVFTIKRRGLHHQSQISSLLAVLGQALTTTTTMKLHIEKLSGCAVAAPLAPACPRLRVLSINKHISRELLAVFGRSCPELSSMRVAGDFICEGVQDMQQLLPHLSRLEMSTLHRMHMDYDDEPADHQDSCLGLLSCTTLKYISLSDSLSDTVWNSFPDGLAELRCRAHDRDPHPGARKPLLQLRSITLTDGESGGVFWSELLRNVLGAAPRLQHLSMVVTGRAFTPLSVPWILCACTPDEVLCIHSLHQAVEHGLRIDGGLNIWLSGKPHEKKSFLASLTSMPLVNGIYLTAVNTADTQACCRKLQLFPGITSFALNSHRPVRLSKILPHLAVCNNLQRLALITQSGRYNTQLLAALIPSILSLRTLHLHHTGRNLARGVRTTLARLDRAKLLHMFPNLDVFVSSDRAVANGPQSEEEQDAYSDPENLEGWIYISGSD